MLGQLKNVKNEMHVLEQYLLYLTCAYATAHSKAPVRVERRPLLLLPSVVVNELLVCVGFACM